MIIATQGVGSKQIITCERVFEPIQGSPLSADKFADELATLLQDEPEVLGVHSIPAGRYRDSSGRSHLRRETEIIVSVDEQSVQPVEQFPFNFVRVGAGLIALQHLTGKEHTQQRFQEIKSILWGKG